MKTLTAIGRSENGKIVEFEVVNGYVDCRYNNLIELHLPDEVKSVNCSHNKLTELHLPDGIEEVDCSFNNLTELHLPDGVEEVWCLGNKLTELHLPDGVKRVWCSNNNFANNESYFVNPKTGRVVIKQGDMYSCGCCCMKTKEQLYKICKEKGFTAIINHFQLDK